MQPGNKVIQESFSIELAHYEIACFRIVAKVLW